MVRATRTVTAALLVGALGGPLAAQERASAPLSTEAIAALAVPATVTIVTFGPQGDTLGLGSGFLVRSSGVLVTNFHVMAGAVRAQVRLASGERFDRVEALDADQAADVAVLKIPGYGLPTLSVTAALPSVGAKLVAVGNPLGLQHTVSEGIVSAVRLVDGRELVQMSAPISPGSSGGPVLNVHGEVVAMATSYLARGQNLNFAVPVRYAIGLVQAARVPVPLARLFGGSEATTSQTTAEAPAATGAAPATANWRPARTATPRAAIEGTWGFHEFSLLSHASRNETATYSGLLFLGAHDVGLLVQVQDSVAHPPVRVYGVASHTATADGRVAVVVGNEAYDGYQTDRGFYLEGMASAGQDTLVSIAWARPQEVPLTDASGLYDVEGNTTMTFKTRDPPSSASWAGEAAVVLANDSIYIDLFLTNAQGGTAAATLSGPVTEGHFDLRSASGKHLLGTTAAGRLVLDWTDPRQWGRYTGVLTGRRK